MDASTKAEPGPNRDLARGLIAFALALGPALAAIAWVPEFVTQDGPAHLYSARILDASLASGSPFSKTFEVSWSPLPNWAGHVGTMALVAALPPGPAGRVMTALTLVAFAASLVWLRVAVAGSKGLAGASVLASLLALNVTWLLGFTSFLMGAALMPATLALWWGGREWFGAGRALGLSILLVLGYFCHPISLGLTIVGLAVLAALTPGMDNARRGFWTFASLLPLVPLALVYHSLTRSGGGLEPVWENLAANPWSLRSWANQATWVDPISLASKKYRPFGEAASGVNGLASPAVWTVFALAVLALSTWARRAGDRMGWLVLSSLLLLGGLLGPDTLGVKHGHYLPQRVALLGLAALVPWLEFGRFAGRVGTGLLVLALGLQSAFVWDYAMDCRKAVGSLVKAGPALGTHRRVGTLLVGIKGRFRSNPMLHADCLFGVGPDHVIWNNYETAHYYFPVKVRAGVEHPPAEDFEKVSLFDPEIEAAERAGLWEAILDQYGRSIDEFVEWSESDVPQLDAINRRQGYEETFREGPVRVWTRRKDSAKSQGS